LFRSAAAIRFRVLSYKLVEVVMRAEIEAIVEEIKQSVRLLRRNL
jgi:hypothetical protein